jgi:hypothetical protein
MNQILITADRLWDGAGGPTLVRPIVRITGPTIDSVERGSVAAGLSQRLPLATHCLTLTTHHLILRRFRRSVLRRRRNAHRRRQVVRQFGRRPKSRRGFHWLRNRRRRDVYRR